MARRYDWNPPTEVKTGEPFNIGAYMECVDTSCRGAVVSLYLFNPYTDDPLPLFVSSWPDTVPAGSQTPINPGIYVAGYDRRAVEQKDWLSVGPSREFFGAGSWNTLIIDRPGDYKLRMVGMGRIEHEFTVVDQQVQPDVSVDCSMDVPTDPSPGDRVTLTATLSNSGGTPATVDIDFSLGAETQTQTVSISAGGEETATQQFTVGGVGSYNASVDYTLI